MARRRLPDEIGIVVVLALVAGTMSLLSDNFGTVSNLRTLLLNGTVIAFLALGQTFVLLTGGIDLSTGANIALTGVLAAVLMEAGLPWWAAALLALGAGTLLGVVNGAIIHHVGLPPFIVTFSTFGVATSIPQIITGASSVSVADPLFFVIGRGSLFDVPMPVVLVAVAAVLATVALRLTPLGVHIYALGGNAEASRLAGVDIARTTIAVYAVSGFCAGMGGLITASRLGQGYPSAGANDELFFSIAAAVVGGVSLFGGIGSVAGALLGATLIATVSNGLNVLGVDSYWQSLVIGLIILGGVTLDTARRRVTLRQLAGRRGSPGPAPGGTPASRAPSQV